MEFPELDNNNIQWSVPREQLAQALSEKPLLIMLHGYASHEGDLFSLAQYLPEKFVVASLRGPLNAASSGYAWFDLSFDEETKTLRRDVAQINASAQKVLEWLDSLEAEVGGLNQIALMGFSQGGVMVTQLFRYQPERFAAGVFLSSFAVEDTTAGAPERDAALAEEKPPLFWGRDLEDPMMTPELNEFTRRWLPEFFDLDAVAYPHIGHSISMEEVENIGSFLTKNVL